jgi:hypothetical protein
MDNSHIPPTATRADVFMLIVRVMVLGTIKGFVLGRNTHREFLDEALESCARHGIAPIHLVNVSNVLVALLHTANAEYDAIDNQSERLN